jgi:hypothetical protein
VNVKEFSIIYYIEKRSDREIRKVIHMKTQWFFLQNEILKVMKLLFSIFFNLLYALGQVFTRYRRDRDITGRQVHLCQSHAIQVITIWRRIEFQRKIEYCLNKGKETGKEKETSKEKVYKRK